MQRHVDTEQLILERQPHVEPDLQAGDPDALVPRGRRAVNVGELIREAGE
jgi:hypothetical protein